MLSEPDDRDFRIWVESRSNQCPRLKRETHESQCEGHCLTIATGQAARVSGEPAKSPLRDMTPGPISWHAMTGRLFTQAQEHCDQACKRSALTCWQGSLASERNVFSCRLAGHQFRARDQRWCWRIQRFYRFHRTEYLGGRCATQGTSKQIVRNSVFSVCSHGADRLGYDFHRD